ncbi:MAG: hypothetical protein K2K40_08085 [Paramuribaculum sp.]|nr:hypothetical protein [Paramuribaculum sp.]
MNSNLHSQNLSSRRHITRPLYIRCGACIDVYGPALPPHALLFAHLPAPLIATTA